MHVRSLHLDRHLTAVAHHRAMHLAQRRCRDGRPFERVEGLREPHAQLVLDDALDVSERKRLDVVLQTRERLEVCRRQQISARRKQLAELDEGGTELFQIGGEGERFRRVALDLVGRGRAGACDEVRVPVLRDEPREVAVPAEPGSECHHRRQSNSCTASW